MANEELFKQAFGSLSEETKKAFVSKYDTLDDAGKQQAISKLIDLTVKAKPVALQEKRQENLSQAANPMNPLGTIQAAGEAFEREEAIAAAPDLAMALKQNPVFGREYTLPESTTELISKAVAGELNSPFKESGQISYGDVYRAQGYPEGVASILGYAKSLSLPSNMLGAGVASKTGKLLVKPLETKFNKTLQKASQELSKAERDIRTVFERSEAAVRNLGLLDEKTKTAWRSSLTGVPEQDIAYKTIRPKETNVVFGTDKAGGDLVNKLTHLTFSAKQKNPDVFGIGDNRILHQAEAMAQSFRGQEKVKGAALQAAEASVPDPYRVPKDNISTLIDMFLREKDYGSLSKDGKLLINDWAKDTPQIKFLSRMAEKIHSFEGKDGKLSLKEIKAFKGLIRDAELESSPYTNDIIRKPHEEVGALAERLYKGINVVFKREFNDSPQLLSAYEDYAKYADLRASFVHTYKNPYKLAKFIRNIPKKEDEDLILFNQVLDSLPDGQQLKSQITNLVSRNENSIEKHLPFLGEESRAAVEAGWRRLIDKNIAEYNPSESRALFLLGRKLGFNPLEISDHQVARSFLKNGRLFQGLAAGGSLQKIASGIGIGGAATSAMTGTPIPAAIGAGAMYAGFKLTNAKQLAKYLEKRKPYGALKKGLSAGAASAELAFQQYLKDEAREK